jgi:hypothetical protein
MILLGFARCAGFLMFFPSCFCSGGRTNDQRGEESKLESEGLNPDMVTELYFNVAKLDSIYSMPIIKNGKLIAEKYFNLAE